MKHLRLVRFDTECHQCGTRLKVGETHWIEMTAVGSRAYCAHSHRGGRSAPGASGTTPLRAPGPGAHPRQSSTDRSQILDFALAKSVLSEGKQPLVDVKPTVNSIAIFESLWTEVVKVVRGRMPLLWTGETESDEFLLEGYHIGVFWSRYDFGDYHASVTVTVS